MEWDRLWVSHGVVVCVLASSVMFLVFVVSVSVCVCASVKHRPSSSVCVPVACVVDVHVAVGLVDVDVAVGLVAVDVAVGLVAVDVAVGLVEVEVAVGLVVVHVVVDVVVLRLVESGVKGSRRWSSGRGESGVLSVSVPVLLGRLAAG